MLRVPPDDMGGDEMMMGPNLWFVTEVGHQWDESGDTHHNPGLGPRLSKINTPLQHSVLAQCPGELAVTDR